MVFSDKEFENTYFQYCLKITWPFKSRSVGKFGQMQRRHLGGLGGPLPPPRKKKKRKKKEKKKREKKEKKKRKKKEGNLE